MEPYKQLEHDWAKFNCLDPAGMVACASGTAALHLALEAMRKRNRGNHVMLGDFNMIACARAAVLADMKPIFIDCDTRLNIDADIAYDAVWDVNANNMHGRGYAVMATHIYGRRCDVDKLSSCASDCALYLVEDLAEAHGVKPHSSTDAACWSFYKNKIVAGEEGGAVWFRDNAHAALARQLRSLGFTDAHDFTHIPRGHNYRMSNAHASLILQSIEAYTVIVLGRRHNESLYDDACPDEWRMPPRHAPWVYDLRIPGLDVLRQDRIVAELNAAGIAARHAFKPMHLQPEFQSCRFVGGNEAGRAAKEVIYLPLVGVTEEGVRQVFEIIREVVGKDT